jgi:hypothetical protein
MPHPFLNIDDHLAGIGLVPAPVQVLSGKTQLDDEIAGQVLRFDLCALLPPQAEEGGLIIAHDDPGIGATDEIAPIRETGIFSVQSHCTLLSGSPAAVLDHEGQSPGNQFDRISIKLANPKCQ